MLIIQAITGIVLGLMLMILGFALATPLFIQELVNKPNGLMKSGFHLFTFPEEGKVKLIIRGDRLIRMVMLYAGHKFKHEKTTDDPEHWEVIPTANGEKAEDPLTGIFWMFKPWAYYVYATTGAVFTGIYPFQTVREYQLERTVIIRKEDETPGVGRKSNITLAVRRDISDHHRVREFQLPFHVEAADTKGKVPVSIIGTIKARVVNPHRAAYGTDRWDIQLINLVTDTLQRFAKRTELDDVLTASSKRAAGAINKVLTTIKDDQIKYGIEIVGFDITDISPVLSDEDLSKLQAEELAKQLGKATRIDGQARADALRAVNDANKVGGTDAVATMQAEALVRAASAVKSGNVILNAGTNSGMADSTSTAILTELQKLNKNLEKGTP